MREAQEAKGISGADGARPAEAPLAVRCVVLVGKDAAAPEKLVAGLRRRGADVRVVSDAPAAMVELGQGASAMVLHQPESIARLAELRDAALRYHPRVPHWRSATDAQGRAALEPMITTQARAASPATANASVNAPTNKQENAQANAPSRPPRPARPAAPVIIKPQVDDSPLVTAEEMAMLLGTPQEEEGPRGGA